MKLVNAAFILLLSAEVIAQDDPFRNSLRVGINAVLFTSGDLVGLGNYGEYSYSFNDRFAIVPRIMSATADQDFGTESVHLSALGGSVAVRYTPFPEFYRGLKFDLGPTFQRIKETSTRSGAIAGTQWSITNSVKNGRENYFGAIGSLSLGILQGERLGAGLRLEMITSFKQSSFNNEMLQAGIFLSVGF